MSNDVHEQMRALYGQIPRLPCKRQCQESCGPIRYSKVERSRIIKSSGSAPKPDETFICTHLKDGSCMVYRIRPMLCRLWGCVPSMRCPWGCEPEFWLTEEQGRALLNESLRIGGHDERGEREMIAALAAAITQKEEQMLQQEPR